MSEWQFFHILLFAFAGMAAVVFILLFFVSAPYGRHSRSGWGVRFSNRAGWLWMEAPASILFFFYFLVSDRKTELVPVFFLVLWQSHYFYRAFMYPFTLQKRKSMPLTVVFFAVLFNFLNTYLQGRWIFTLSPETAYTTDWITDPRFLVGVLMFYGGYVLNRHADRTLRFLRKSGRAEYAISQKGLFRMISCPNYLGEILQWFGWAIAVWALPGLLFALWTVANLLPRARSHHLWYRKSFADYPRNRKALIPYIY
jgi:3-oxo-5-alpha-steroid 4-dehydrogenase 1